MSSDKNLFPKSVSKNSDSFDDRFCDDLSQVLLQYLSLEDRLRLECVSKQFQRTVYQNVYHLLLDDKYVSVTQKLDKLFKKSEKLNCFKKLKTLSIDCINSDINEFVPKLKAFPALKRFELWSYFPKIFSFEAFKGISNITHLSFRFGFSGKQTLKESTLKEIDINLPKLQYLEIQYPFKTTPEGVTQMVDFLSRLLRLETLKLNFNLSKYMRFCLKSGVEYKPLKIQDQFTEKCRQIKTIKIDFDL